MANINMRGPSLVLVTGAGGYLGGHLVPALLQAGLRVRASDLPGVPLNHLQAQGAEVLSADLTCPEGLDRAAAGADVIIHAAALFDLTAPPERLRAANVTGTDNLCQAARRQGVRRLIHISSCDVYGPLVTVPADEDHPFRPLNAYARSKAGAEAVVRRHAQAGDLQVTVLRPSVMYGPGSRYIACILFAIPAILAANGVRRIPFFKGGSRFTPVHVEDVARAITFMAQHPECSGRAYNIAQPEITTVGAFFQEIFRTMGLRFLLTVPLSRILVEMGGRIGMSLPEWMIAGAINSYLDHHWQAVQRRLALAPDFVLRFNRDIFSYFIGERAYRTDRLLATGFRYRYENEAAGIPPTIRWYVEQRWLPPPPEMAARESAPPVCSAHNRPVSGPGVC
jgi:UDP-glucose 4-epimerase